MAAYSDFVICVIKDIYIERILKKALRYLLHWAEFASPNVHFYLTEKETQALDRHGMQSGDGREVDVLARLSVQSQQVRAEMYHSLHHMRLRRAQLLSSLKQQSQMCDGNIDHSQHVVSSTEKHEKWT